MCYVFPKPTREPAIQAEVDQIQQTSALARFFAQKAGSFADSFFYLKNYTKEINIC
jgi:hypothetical protein